MKAIVCSAYGPPEVLQIKDVTKPIPTPHEILIKVRATTVTVADVRVRAFRVPVSYWLPARIVLGLRKPKKNILGVELAGEVEAVGKEVHQFKIGDKVFAATLARFGGYAEYICLPANGPICLMPAQCSYPEAAAIPIGARTALHYLKKGNVQSGQKVLIYGASGSVGTYAVQLARYFGAQITGVCSSANVALVHSLGATQVLDYTQENFARQLDQYDMIFVAVDKLPFSIARKHLKEEGVYVNVTTPVKSLFMRWTSMTSKKKIFVGANPPESSQDLFFLKGIVEAGVLKPVIDRSYSLDQMVEAHEYVDKGHKKGNVVVIVNVDSVLQKEETIAPFVEQL
jgi:NADPH:quinone reductase-like Zn-dependent oxidoreductase